MPIAAFMQLMNHPFRVSGVVWPPGSVCCWVRRTSLGALSVSPSLRQSESLTAGPGACHWAICRPSVRPKDRISRPDNLPCLSLRTLVATSGDCLGYDDLPCHGPGPHRPDTSLPSGVPVQWTRVVLPRLEAVSAGLVICRAVRAREAASDRRTCAPDPAAPAAPSAPACRRRQLQRVGAAPARALTTTRTCLASIRQPTK